MRKHVKKLIAGLILALAFGSATVVSASAPANASTATFVEGIRYAGGPGHETTVYAGIWSLDGRRGPCIDFNLIAPDLTAGTRVVDQVPGMSPEDSERSFVLVQEYRGTNSNTTAAALALAIWQLRGDPDFKSWYRWAKNRTVPASQVKRVNQMLRESKSHGAYMLSVGLKPGP